MRHVDAEHRRMHKNLQRRRKRTKSSDDKY
jgi:hypothetical protein